MEISSIGVNNNQIPTKSQKNEVQTQTTEQPQTNIKIANEVTTDTFTKSAAADAASKQNGNTKPSNPLDTSASSPTQPQSTQGTAVGKPSSSTPVGADPSRPKTAAHTNSSEQSSSANSDSVNQVTDNTDDKTSAIVTSSSEYTSAEIAQYDTNGDGEIDDQEEAKMKADQARERNENLSTEQVEAKKAYETAKNQLSLSEDETVIDEQL